MWWQGGSLLSINGFDLLRQDQAYIAEPTGNYRDTDIEKHVARKGETGGDPGKTKYTISDVEETTDKLIIKPTLNWWVLDQFKHTSVVAREREHVNRWLWWQGNPGPGKAGDGYVKVREFNSRPTGIKNLKAILERARFDESVWQENNLHAKGRHSLEKNPARDMDPGTIRNLIETIGPDEYPHLRN